MLPLQFASLALALLAPLVLWHVHRRMRSHRFAVNAARAIAVLLLALYSAELSVKWSEGGLIFREALPMQLCDWALFAVAGALLWRSQTMFELGYFWGLCGTLQALFTPAIAHDLPWWKHAGFFLAHAGIVAGVLVLLLVARMRPRSLWRVVLWSEIYLAAALAVNALTAANYGFLSHRPETPSMLDLFAQHRWLYVAEINAVALVCFATIYLPWLIADRRRRPPAAPTPPP